MRIFIISFFLLAGYVSANGQLKHSTLQAAGLTCAMCSNAIYQSLSSLPFIEEVAPDVANSSFQIKFKADKNIDPDRMRNAVEEAGFSVAALRFTISFNNYELSNDKILSMHGLKLFVINSNVQVLDRDITFRLVDKGFLTEKSLKEYEKKLGVSLRKNKKASDEGLYTVIINQE